ncbi:MAG: formylglycine-generating enzyme family protein, partial [Bacteroidota bacterium]
LYTESPTLKRRLCTYTANGYSFQMVPIPKGRFWMGDDNSEYDDEKPAHWVSIAQDFELGQYPVTQGLWEAVMGDNPSYFKGAERPVEQVSWDDIMGTKEGEKQDQAKKGFLDRLNALPEIAAQNAADGCCFGLPSEAQWEYAARGGEQVHMDAARVERYGQYLNYTYAGSNYLPEVGWYDDNSKVQTHEVGCKLPNALGLYDMSGNVWEWCEDAWQGSYKNAPKDGSPQTEGEKVRIRVVRGGSWDFNDYYSRAAFRSRSDADFRYVNMGFRLSRYHLTL